MLINSCTKSAHAHYLNKRPGQPSKDHTDSPSPQQVGEKLPPRTSEQLCVFRSCQALQGEDPDSPFVVDSSPMSR